MTIKRWLSRPKTCLAVWLLVAVAFVLAWQRVVQWPAATDFAAKDALPYTPTAEPQQQPKGRQMSPDGQFHFDAQFVSSSPGQAVHAASMVELNNGDLRAVWFAGSREGAGDVSIQTAVMDAETFRWGAETTLLDRPRIQRDLQRYVKKLGNPVIGRAPDGSLNLWLVTVSLGGWAGSSITWARSVDDGKTWSRAQRLVTSPFLNISTLSKGAPVALSGGQVALPVYHEFITKFAEIVRISPEGRVVDKVRIPASGKSLQPSVIVTSPLDAAAFMRSGKATALMMSATNDGGKSWSPAQATSWPNPDAAVAGVAMRDGTQWLALNPTTQRREQLALLQIPRGSTLATARLRLVEGSAASQARLPVTDFERLLEQELGSVANTEENATSAYVASARRQLCNARDCTKEFSYPYLLQSRDGALHLIYTWHRSRIKHIRLDPLQSAMLTTAAP